MPPTTPPPLPELLPELLPLPLPPWCGLADDRDAAGVPWEDGGGEYRDGCELVPLPGDDAT